MMIKNKITINTPIEKVWDALINPKFTTQYMFGCVPLTDWKVGSPLLWQGKHEGQEIVFVKGSVIAFKPSNSLIYTVIDPLNPNIQDVPENYLNVTYSLKKLKEKTIFTVTQGDYSKVAEGKKRYDDSVKAGDWKSILESIKKLVEIV